MTTNTELANSALALLGELPIAAISDTTRPAILCNRFADSARIEVLRLMHLSEVTALASMDALATEAVAVRLAARLAVPLLASQEAQGKMEQLFAVRLQEAKHRILQSSALNGKILAMIGADLAKADLTPTMLAEFSTTFQAEATKEVLRMGRWNCAIRRATLTASTAAWNSATSYTVLGTKVMYGGNVWSLIQACLNVVPGAGAYWLSTPAVGDFGYSYFLPSGCLRVLEVNGEAASSSAESFEIEGAFLLSNDSTVWVRYVDSINLPACDPLLAAAVHARHALKIAVALTLPSAGALEGLFQKRLSEARQHDAMENGGGEKPSWARVFGRSRLLTAKTRTRNPLRLEDY